MTIFANINWLPYIALSVFVTALLFVFFLVWKRNIIRHFTGGRDGWRLITASKKTDVLRSALIFILLFLSAILLLRPQWGDHEIDVVSEGSDLLVIMDVSRSMMAEDAGGTRLSRAKDAVRLLLEANRGGRTGLVLFAGDAFLQCPLTSDSSAFMMFLDSASPDSVSTQGTDIGKALSVAFSVFQKKRLTSRIAVIITDGEDHEGGTMDAVSKFREMGVSLYAVGVGRSDSLIPSQRGGENLYSGSREIRTSKNRALLGKMASDTGGKYIDITDTISGMSAAVEAFSSEKKNRDTSRKIREKRDRYHIFALFFILIAGTELFLSSRRCVNASDI